MSLWMRFLALLMLAGPSVLHAQFSTDSPAGISAGLARLFEIKAFTANADVQVLEANGAEALRTRAKFAFLDGKIRVDLDAAQMAGNAVEPAVIAALKQAGLDRISSVVRLDQKMIHLVFPGARSCVSMPMSKTDAEMAGQGLKVSRVSDGTEVVGGRNCERNKVRVTNAKNTTLLEATTWTAVDSKNFPVQVAVHADGKTTLVRFTQVQLTRPNSNLFEAPSAYNKYPSVELLLFASIQKQGGTPVRTEKGAPIAGGPAQATVKQAELPPDLKAGARPKSTSPRASTPSAPSKTQRAPAR